MKRMPTKLGVASAALTVVALTAACAELAEASRGLRPAERARLGLPCPFLADDSCSIYPVRPLVCRGANSADVAACIRAFGPAADGGIVPQYGPQVALYHGIHDGLVAALAAAGRPAETLCLFPAMQIALTEPEAARRWCAGETLFDAARADVHRQPEARKEVSA